MNLVSGVYHRIPCQQPYDTHPIIVVLEIEGSNECLVIPAFTAGRVTIENLIQAHEATGVSRDALVVEMNNQIAVNWHSKFDAKDQIYWATMLIDKIDRTLIRKYSPKGTMKPEYLLLLYRSISAFMQSKLGHSQFSDPIKKKIRQCIKKLEELS